jgi:hypothetical protein
VIYGGRTPSIDWKTLLQSPALFPFQLQALRSDVMAGSGRIEVIRHNLADELLVLRKPAEDLSVRS